MMRTMLLPLVLLLLLATARLAAQEAVDSADVAWRSGNMEAAERLYSARLAADSADLAALHRVALLRAWNERYDESIALFDRLLSLSPTNREAIVDRARVLAWRNDIDAALAALDELLIRDPSYLPGLQARAQFASWAGAYAQSLSAYDRMLEITPDDVGARLGRARVLGWAGDSRAAIAAYGDLLRTEPENREVRLGLAQALAGGGQLDSAVAVYRGMLARDSADTDARRGLARSRAWAGELIAAEREWRRAIADHPDDVAARVGLAQTLRWQGRDAAAYEELQIAGRLAPTDADALAELSWVRAAFAPRVAPAAVYASDSDGNRIATYTLAGRWRVRPRWEVRGDAYLRTAEQAGTGGFLRQALGGSIGATRQIQPGWLLSADAGWSTSDAPGAGATPILRAALASPGRLPLSGTLAFSRSAFDATAALVEQQVVTEEASLSLNARVTPEWSASGGASLARFRGRENNRRAAAHFALDRRSGRSLTLGLAARSFRFAKDLNDGYFDPDRYRLAETRARWFHEGRRWNFSIEAAPGVQQIGDSDPSGSFRSTARVGHLLAPGREIALSVDYSTAGLQQLSPATAAYEYQAISLTAGWAF